ncbi:hypothetical protein [Dactylosporangium sp. NPDC000521]|uniref:hypothetical protein n=1 Tax=Dactylosporangium sp. NPDC000521 TaxID=3363975 RepID=UPI0036B2465A
MRTILIVGGGYAGFYTAWKLEKKLRRGEVRGRILPEVTDKPGEWVVRSLEKRGGHVHLNAQVPAVPTGERKFRVLAVWATAVPFGRDVVSLTSVQHPRAAFLAGAGPRVSAPARGAGAVEARVLAGDAPRS